MIYNLNRRELSRARADFAKTQERAATGRRVLKPSDDPLATSLARQARSREVRAEGHLRAIDAGRAAIDVADSALGDVAEVVRRVKEITLVGATATVTASERAAMSREVDELRQSIVALGNAESGGSYVFAGYPDDSPPFDATGAYFGDGSVREVEVGVGVRLGVGVSGSTAFGVGTPTDVLATLDAIVTALASDDVPAIQTAIDTIDLVHDQVVEARVEVGARMSAFETAHQVATRTRDLATIRQGEQIGADPVDAFLDFERAQSALETAVQIAAQLPPAGLAQG